MVEVGKTQEGLYFLPVRWSRPFRYSSYFDWVRLNGILGNNHSKVLHFCFLPLLRFKEEIVFLEQLCYDFILYTYDFIFTFTNLLNNMP